MTIQHNPPRRTLTAIVTALVVAIASIAGSALASSHPALGAQAKPTIVLVHGGAFPLRRSLPAEAAPLQRPPDLDDRLGFSE